MPLHLEKHTYVLDILVGDIVALVHELCGSNIVNTNLFGSFDGLDLRCSAFSFSMFCIARDRDAPTQKGEPISWMFSTTTLVALPTVRGMGRAKVVDEPPAVPEFYSER